MLTIEKITYPITFTSFGSGKVTFKSPKFGIWHDGNNCGLEINHFITRHNNINPKNVEDIDYHYTVDSAFDRLAKCDDVESKSGKCKVEHMPLGATLTAVQLDDESWLEMKITPRRIEVDADVVTFLLHSHYQPNTKKSRFAGEVSVARGAIVRWEK